MKKFYAYVSVNLMVTDNLVEKLRYLKENIFQSRLSRLYNLDFNTKTQHKKNRKLGKPQKELFS